MCPKHRSWGVPCRRSAGAGGSHHSAALCDGEYESGLAPCVVRGGQVERPWASGRGLDLASGCALWTLLAGYLGAPVATHFATFVLTVVRSHPLFTSLLHRSTALTPSGMRAHQSRQLSRRSSTSASTVAPAFTRTSTRNVNVGVAAARLQLHAGRVSLEPRKISSGRKLSVEVAAGPTQTAPMSK